MLGLIHLQSGIQKGSHKKTCTYFKSLFCAILFSKKCNVWDKQALFLAQACLHLYKILVDQYPKWNGLDNKVRESWFVCLPRTLEHGASIFVIELIQDVDRTTCLNKHIYVEDKKSLTLIYRILLANCRALFVFFSYKKWVSLTSHMTVELVVRLQPECGTVTSVTQFLSPVSDTKMRKEEQSKMAEMVCMHLLVLKITNIPDLQMRNDGHYLCCFFTRSYVWPLVRIVSKRRF